MLMFLLKQSNKTELMISCLVVCMNLQLTVNTHSVFTQQ